MKPYGIPLNLSTEELDFGRQESNSSNLKDIFVGYNFPQTFQGSGFFDSRFRLNPWVLWEMTEGDHDDEYIRNQNMGHQQTLACQSSNRLVGCKTMSEYGILIRYGIELSPS